MEEDWLARLREALVHGSELDLAPGVSDADMLGSLSPDPNQEVPAEAVRKVLLDPQVRPDPRGLLLRGATITGSLDLSNLIVPFPVHLHYCTFIDDVVAQLVQVVRLSLIGARARRISLDQVRIDGSLILRNATLTNEGGDALSLNLARVGGDLIAERLTTLGRIRAPGAAITGQLNLCGATLSNQRGDVLYLDGASVGGGVFMREVTTTGQIRAPGATFAGQLGLQRARLTNSGGDALVLDGCTVEGGVFCQELTTTGKVSIRGARISGEVRLHRARLASERGSVLSLDRAKLGSVFAAGLTARGEVSAIGATVAGQLILDEATLTNEEGDALSLDGATVGTSLAARGLAANGQVRAVGASIAGQFDLQRASLTSSVDHALALEGATVGGVFLLTPARIDGQTDLAFASIAQLVAGEAAADAAILASPVVASGWRLGDVHGWLRTDRKAARTWLDRGAQAFHFASQPWHELANVYERDGQLADARWMRYQAARRISRSGPRLSRLLGALYNVFAGHGYYPLVAGAWLAVALLLSWGLILVSEGSFAPTNPGAAVQPGPHPAVAAERITGATSCEDLAPTYPCFEPTLYTLETALPAAISLGEAAAWRPIGTGVLSVSVGLPIALSALKTFIWIMAALLLAGVTGLLRRT